MKQKTIAEQWAHKLAATKSGEAFVSVWKAARSAAVVHTALDFHTRGDQGLHPRCHLFTDGSTLILINRGKSVEIITKNDIAQRQAATEPDFDKDAWLASLRGMKNDLQ